ncbi:hypothetical protein MHA_0209 [Mannheimia haemolytica PHL213]|nr:hypothetical protein MHA_0209 [Mannheimia haemolytica PHL213]
MISSRICPFRVRINWLIFIPFLSVNVAQPLAVIASVRKKIAITAILNGLK